MKLSELIAYRTLIDSQENTQKAWDNVRQVLDNLHHIVNVRDIQWPNLTQQLNQHLINVEQELVEYNKTLQQIRCNLETEISKQQHDYLSRSYQLYENEMVHDDIETQLNRRLNLTTAALEVVTSRIMKHSDWRSSGMILRPGLEDWIGHLVGLDPLYLVDFDHEYFGYALAKFNPVYQKRLRKYVISESSNGDMFENLPQGQFGTILAYNFFHYKPFEVLRQYLQELYDLLCPGGMLLMTFNDCDRSGGVKNVERNYMCYTPGGMVKGLCESLGFEIVYFDPLDSAVSWMELRRPGQRVSMRAGQSISQLRNYETVDKGHDPAYSVEHREALINEAIKLEIDTPLRCRYTYTPRELEKLIKRRKKENARPFT